MGIVRLCSKNIQVGDILLFESRAVKDGNKVGDSGNIS